MNISTDGTASPDERNAAIKGLLFAPDWLAARDLVMSEPWLLSPQADDDIASVSARCVEQEKADPNMIPLAGAVAIVRERLGRARQLGAGSAFDDLIALDERLRAIAGMRWAADLYAAVKDEPQLNSDLGIDELRLMLTRVYPHDESLGQQLWKLHNVMLRTRQEGIDFFRLFAEEQQQRAAVEADQIFAPLRLVAPPEATRQNVEECKRALELLERQTGSDLWFEAQARLGSFLLELRDGDRIANVAGARAIYKSILDHDPNESSAAWAAAVCGYANSLTADPEAAPAEFERSLALLDALVGRLRQTGDVDTLVVALSCYASALVAAPTGDRDELIERALDAQREEIRVLRSADRNPERWGRAHLNLGRLYSLRRLGARSQNVDEAVRALRVALEVRSRENDPVGRARTLRNLAIVLPEWSGADSQAIANAMADACRQEAAAIASEDPRATARPAEWGGLAGESSALDRDLDSYLALSPNERVVQLEAAIEQHRGVIARLSRERTPAQWAEWKGGMGRLQALLAYSKPEAAREAYANLTEAIEAVPSSSRSRLTRDLHAAIGGLGHQIGEWNISLLGHANALVLSDTLFDEAATPESRSKELADMRGFALFGAYAATRLGKLHEAVQLAEHGRGRSMVEALATAELIANGASSERRSEIESASRRVMELEEELRAIADDDATAIAEKMRNRLADAIGADPRLLNFRVTDKGRLTQDKTKDYIRIQSELHAARAALRSALAKARAESSTVIPERLDAAAVVAVASQLECPIVYVLATVYGSAAIFVLPEGRLDSLLLDAINSDSTRAVVYGAGEKPGYANGAMTGDASTLRATLPDLLDMLRTGIMEPLSQHVTTLGHERAVLIPLGSLGLLPLHAAITSSTPAFAYAPSARALSLAIAERARAADAPPSLLAIGNPRRESIAPLPFAIAEVRVAEQFTSWSQKTVLVGPDACLSSVVPAARAATHLHFACHGEFRPSDPLESALLLAGEEKITLHMLLTGSVSLLTPRFAVLSACQTANVEFRSLPDEVLGLPSGLLLAGVPGVVATMWPVDDRATAFFSQRFYEELFVAKREPTAAVAAAQRWLRDASAAELHARAESMRQALVKGDDDADAALSKTWRGLVSRSATDHPFTSPEFWAAFTYVGV
jgi:CHAT domain-containing protein